MTDEYILLYGNSYTNSNIYYVTKFLSPDPFLCLVSKDLKDKKIFLSEMEVERALKESNANEIKSYRDYNYDALYKRYKDPGVAFANLILKILKEQGIKKISVMRDFPSFFYEFLKDKGLPLKILKDPFRDMRRRKGEEELNKIKKAQKACEISLETVKKIIEHAKVKKRTLYYKEKELTSEYLRITIEKTLLENGSFCDGVICASGRDSSDPHSVGHGVIREGEPIVIDIFPNLMKERYYSDMTRTYVKGEPDEDLLNMYNAVFNAQELAFKELNAGRRCEEVHLTVCEYFESLGYGTERKNDKEGFIHSTGHGVGLDVHEPPFIGRNEERLVEGDVVTIEPGLYYKEIGGVRLEDIVAIKRDGYVNLTKLDKKFIIG